MLLSSIPIYAVLLVALSQASTAAHAGFHVQYPWLTRRPSLKVRGGIQRYNPFCGDIFHNPQRYGRSTRTFLSFAGHPGDEVTVLYSRSRAPRARDDFPHLILQDVPIGATGQLCLNVTIPFETEEGEFGVMYFEARDPATGDVQFQCSDVKMIDIESLPEEHPAMCAQNNDTLIPMPDEYL